MKKYILTPLLAGFLIVGATSCATVEEQKMGEAKAEIKKAKKMGNEWRDSMKFLKKAQKAIDAGDTKKASKLIEKARKQGVLAQQQAKAQMNVNGPY